jgi:hypothetical protein
MQTHPRRAVDPPHGRPASPWVRPDRSRRAAGFAGTDAPAAQPAATRTHPRPPPGPPAHGCVQIAAGGRLGLHLRMHPRPSPLHFGRTPVSRPTRQTMGASRSQQAGGWVCTYGRTRGPARCISDAPPPPTRPPGPWVRPDRSGRAAGFAPTDAPAAQPAAFRTHPRPPPGPPAHGCVRIAAGGRLGLQVRTHPRPSPLQFGRTPAPHPAPRPVGASRSQQAGGWVCRYGRTRGPARCNSDAPAPETDRSKANVCLHSSIM